ncbi:TadE/TadG family type IV pilus assembly protein [Sphingomonas sp. C3-2]|uniref:TadE/TadG family type IV pilus assembly protein n=1 Tax=Sphingomonas sp. C3-2 TaxID=3062169 RepID=UPI00294ACACF|nr:hypothetical protein [Sphingomonas sp. C3-2]WOK36969.1 hypothetical protein QYC26_01880 [Sphingomonas sp. C3-2]
MKIAGRLRRAACGLWKAKSGVAYIEFAYAFPVLIVVGFGGLEAANLALAHMRTSQVALSMADNASRIGQDSALSLTQFRESDAADSFAAAEKQAGRFNVVGQGRVILSSLQQNEDGGQWIAWQRCLGSLGVASSYGIEDEGKTGTTFAGMGPATNRITAPANNAVMFVEIFYDYEPLISSAIFGRPRLHYTAAFSVRDERDLTKIYPSNGVSPARC